MLDLLRSFLSSATPAQRCIMVICTEIPFLLAFMAGPSVGLLVPELNSLLVPRVIITGNLVMGAVIVANLFMLRWLWPRRKRPNPLPGMYAAITMLATLAFATTALEGGNLTYPSNLVIICLVPCGLLMLDMRSTGFGLLLGLLLIMINDLADFTGMLRYAPGYGPDAFVGDSQRFMAELLRTGILYVSIISYGILIWILFDQYDHYKQKLTILSQMDILTGLANRRYFMERLQTECGRLGRTQRNFCLVMIDADHFKKINDTHGHQVGDDVLRAIAHTLGQHMRIPTDLPARIGGEEFALLLPDTHLAGARAVCDRIRASLGRLTFQGAEGTFKVTLSMGVVENAGHDAEVLLHFADANLYLAKGRGRNCVVSSSPESHPVAADVGVMA